MQDFEFSGPERRKSTKAAIYIRVSTEEQAKEGISMKAQEERCRAFCIARGWDVFKIYKDPGFSAKNLSRPAMKRVLQDAKDKKFRVLVVYKFDRFSRNLKDLLFTLEDLRKLAINFTSVTEQIDTTTAMGKAFFRIIGVFAELERDVLKERVDMAFAKKIMSGEALNRAPFGYAYDKGRLVPDVEKAPLVQQIFEMKADGIHYKDIAQNANLAVSSLFDMLRNPVYLGKIKYRGRLYNGLHKAIISEDLFKKVNPQFEIPDDIGSFSAKGQK